MGNSKDCFPSAIHNDFLSYATGNYSKSTVAIYRSALNRLLSIAENLPLASITAQQFDTYRVERLKDVSPASVNIELRTLRAFFNTALRWGHTERNPFAHVKLASVPEATPIFFSKEDFQKLLNAIKEGWLKEIIVFATLTGLRRGEIVNLHWSDVSFDRKTLTVRSSPTFKTKQGRRRVVPLNDTALYLLQSRANREISELVFTLNGKPILAGWLSHKFKYYVHECRLEDDRLHFHSLRHTFASWLVQDGVSIYAVKEFL
jgi:integrase